MSGLSATVQLLAQKHPHSAHLLSLFTPMVQAQQTLLAKEQAAGCFALLPEDCTHLGSETGPLFQAQHLPFSQAFLKKTITAMGNAATKALPEKSATFITLKLFLRANPAAARELALLRLQGKLKNVSQWATQHGQPAEEAAFMAVFMGSTIAKYVQTSAGQHAPKNWHQGICPVCGSMPQGSLIKEKEGARFLHCSLCGHEWRYSRTACTFCGHDDPKKLPLFFFETSPEERAEACNTCKHYLLGLDIRKLADANPPLDLYFLCLGPLDVLMQEKGYLPASTTD